MNRIQKTFRSVFLLWFVCTVPVAARIPNHHIFYRNDNRAPLTNLEIVFLGGGSSRDGPDRSGLAVTAARLIQDYSKDRGYTARLEALGARFYVRTYFEYQIFYLSTLSENLDTSVRIVNDLIQRMAITEFALEKAKRDLKQSYQHSVRSRSFGFMKNYALARKTSVQRFFSMQAVEQLTLEEIRQYHEMLVNGDVVFFKAIADLDSVAIGNSLLPFTKGRQRGGFVRSPPTQDAGDLPGHSAFVIDRYSHLENVYLYLLIQCGTVGEDNYVPSMVSSALGSVPLPGMLFDQMRDELGLIYSTSCNYLRSDNIRYLEVFADPLVENSEELITRMSELLVGLADNPRFWETIAELRENRDFARADLHEEMTPSRNLNDEVDGALYNFPSREHGYKSVTDDEIRSFLQKYFIEENMIMILFGPKEHIVEILEKHWPDVTIHVQPVEKAIE